MLLGPLHGHLGLLVCLVVGVRHGVAVPPVVPHWPLRVDAVEAELADELAVDEALIALEEDRHVADCLERLLAGLVAIHHRASQLDDGRLHLAEGIPGAYAVTRTGDTLAPVLGSEDHAARDGVVDHSLSEVVQPSVADELLALAIQDVDAPDERRAVGSGAVEPLVLVLDGRCCSPAEELGDVVVLHAAVTDKQLHVAAPQRSQLDLELAHREAHDWSEH